MAEAWEPFQNQRSFGNRAAMDRAVLTFDFCVPVRHFSTTMWLTNKMQQFFRFFNIFNSALHVSGDKFAHHQEHFLNVYTAFGTMYRHCCRPVPRLRWNFVTFDFCVPVRLFSTTMWITNKMQQLFHFINLFNSALYVSGDKFAHHQEHFLTIYSFWCDWLRAGRSGYRIPVWRDFPPVQTDPEAHAASCTMGTESFPEVK